MCWFISCFQHASFCVYSALFPHRQGRKTAHRSVVIALSFLIQPGAAALPETYWIGQSTRLSVDGSSKGQDEPSAVLEPGKPVKREIAGGESHSYRFTLAAGQFLTAVFDQQGVNLMITLYGPDG